MMHDAAHHYVARWATPDPVSVIELGSLNINGGVRELFPNASYVGVDIVDGNGVDVVADAATWQPDDKADMVICCEVFEHTHRWPQIVANASQMLKPGGRVIFTMAGPGRAPHSAKDGGQLRGDEFYANVSTVDLCVEMEAADLVAIQVEQIGDDVRGTGVKQ